MSTTTRSTAASARTAERRIDEDSVTTSMERACARIAPAWPLDRSIAVNPFWSSIDEPLSSVAAARAALGGGRLLMSREWFRERWLRGEFQRADVRAALAWCRSTASEADVLARLERPTPTTLAVSRVMDCVDRRRDLRRAPSWRDHVTHSTSQFCASYFDDRPWRVGPDRTGGLYASWRRFAVQDRSPELLMGLEGARRAMARLPATADEMAREAVRTLALDESEREIYFTALLLDLHGWASHAAYRRWTARLAGGDDVHVHELLAIRLAWECVLYRSGGDALAADWLAAKSQWSSRVEEAYAAQDEDWILQRALEMAWQRDVVARLSRTFAAGARRTPPTVQAVFCIDVRSETFRRALEHESPSTCTLGFAGFFGLPAEYVPVAATTSRPQMPGLLAPKIRIRPVGGPAEVVERRGTRLALRSAWRRFKEDPFSGFAFVETAGLLSFASLIGDGLGLRGRTTTTDRVGLTEREQAAFRPRVLEGVDGRELDVATRARLAEGILRGMSLTREFARLLVLVGHGSRSSNNPTAANLDCGACCGQTGEVNARAAADLLNQADVRAALAEVGIVIPATTHVLGALHDTTTDAVTLFDLEAVPPSHHEDVRQLALAFDRAGQRCRVERSSRFELSGARRDLAAAFEDRARDWAEVRPEWGLAGNAGFVVAPRSRTAGLDLAGRCFLHEYRWQDDHDFGVLELILTAPMIVTHWINLQYYASTVDPRRYGSGNKVLHNVVGAHLGVFEGNGGDLRIGLPLQSLHDGRSWVHTPLRLSVFVEAPREAIDGVLGRHRHVEALVRNEWLYLFCIDSAAGTIDVRHGGAWVPFRRTSE